MIESRYWKSDLLKHAKDLQPKKNPARMTEKMIYEFEKRLIISFFIVRKMLESDKISNNIKRYRAKIYEYKSKRMINKLNVHSIEKNYDLYNEITISRDIKFISNQFIHSSTIWSSRISKRNRNWSDIYLCSDYEKTKALYRIPIEEIIKIFNLVGNDYPTHTIQSRWNEKTNDYEIEQE